MERPRVRESRHTWTTGNPWSLEPVGDADKKRGNVKKLASPDTRLTEEFVFLDNNM